jgi:hypothetical protein
VERAADASGYVEVHSGDWTDASWTDTGSFAPGVICHYRARRMVGAATSGYSNVADVVWVSGQHSTFRADSTLTDEAPPRATS